MLQRKPTTLKEKATRLDPLGTFFFLPCIICLLLALKWGGVTYNWSNARIIVLLVLSGVLFVAFIFVQRWKGENAAVPGHIFFNRSILAGAWFSFCSGGAVQTLFYFLPIWFQAIKGASALKSGTMLLPLVLALVLASATAGILTRRLGYYAPWLLLSSLFTPVAAGLISTFTPTTAHPAWLSSQTLCGLGLGLGNQQPSVAAQTILPRKDVPIGASLKIFAQNVAGAVFISVGNNVFDAQLAQNLARIDGLDVGDVVRTGATELRGLVARGLLPQVLGVFNGALRASFYLVTATACGSVLGAAGMEWRSVKERKQQRQSEGVGKGGEEERSEKV